LLVLWLIGFVIGTAGYSFSAWRHTRKRAN
jgi:hypothetical protein